MKYTAYPLLLLLSLLLHACSASKLAKESPKKIAPPPEAPQTVTATPNYPEANYNKQEYRIAMRDGIQLHTVVYAPKDASAEKPYPILLKRTPYSCHPYGPTAYPNRLGPSKYLMEEGYIIVYQDVRGRWMSEGLYDNMRPHLPEKKSPKDIDESTDTYDTIDWLLKNVAYHNGRVGQWGISYPGFYTTAGAIEAHPALKASSPQAPIADFYFDDFHHRGAYLLSYFLATTVFGYQKEEPTTAPWYQRVNTKTPDQYRFFLDMGPLKNGDQYYGEDNFFWQQLKSHPNYDEFWQRRNILPHLRNIKHPMMVVGGWFDAEDLYGPLMTYKTIEKHNPGTYNTIVMGPWSHGDWARDKPDAIVGRVDFGPGVSDFFQREIERPFFHSLLKEDREPQLPEAYMYDTGRKRWETFEQWPPKAVEPMQWYLHPKEGLDGRPPAEGDAPFTDFVSDPAKPVPYSEDIKTVFTPRKYMTDDQRFAGRRPDVLVFETPPLEADLTLAGEIMAHLKVATNGTDADWIVKLIDVYPGDHEDYDHNPKEIRMGHYEQMVRSEVIRGRFRNSFENPEPFIPNQVTSIQLPLQDVLHTFKKGHRVMIQIQSTWFPLIDRNPQKYVDNIFEANEEDFIKATHKVYHSTEQATYIEVDVLKTTNTAPMNGRQ
ncbi:MAG: CocE/NonD family hydrolase [Bacteroidota bacterium]